jgi:hypothetical protein
VKRPEAAAIVVGAAAIGFAPRPISAYVPGAAAIAGACAAWAIDSNSPSDWRLRGPRGRRSREALAEGAVSVTIALATGDRLPSITVIVAAVAVGAVGYGASIVLNLLATRGIAASRHRPAHRSAGLDPAPR